MELWRYGHPIKRLGKRYRLDGLLGQGGMADVCLAWDEKEKRKVAIKVIKEDCFDQEVLERFQKEASQVLGWNHPHILRIYDTVKWELVDGSHGSVIPYIVMEYVPGTDLSKRLRPEQPYPFGETLRIFAQLCSAVQYAHEQGIIHRDLKPHNILLRNLPDGSIHAILSDFGLAVRVDATHHTFAEGGSLSYMAPEQFRGKSTQASDIFALGVILYQLCTGKLPFHQSLSTHNRIVIEGPSRPSSINPSLPKALDDVILIALSEDQTKRFASASLFWESVRIAVTPPPVQPQIAPPKKDELAQLSGLPVEKPVPHPSTVNNPVVSNTPSQQSTTPPPSTDAANADEHGDNGGIITFSPTPQSSGRTSGKIPVSSVVPLPESSPDDEAKVTPIQRWRDRGKKAAVGAAVVGTGVGAGVAGVAKATPTPSPSGAPPKPGSAGTPPPRRRRRRALLLLVLAALLLVSVIVCSMIALAAPGTFAVGSAITHALPVGNPTATVIIVPKHADELNFYVIQAIVKGTPDSSKRQVRARLLTSPAETQSKTVNATGVKNFPAVAATGTLTFYNGNNVDELVKASDNIFTVGNVQIKMTQDVDIPATVSAGVPGSIDVPAYADPPGSSGDIAAGAINEYCCGSSTISVKNNNDFGGGQDASTVKVVQQSNIDSAANPLKAPLQNQALASPNLQKQANEQFLDHQPTCKTDVTSDHAAGDQADTVTVTVTVTCTGDVYDQVGAETIAANLLRQQASRDLSTDYKLVGNLVTQIIQVTNDTQGNIDLRIKTEGIWVFQFTDTQIANLKKLIAGKSKPEAKAILLHQPGVDSVGTIEISGANGSTLPTDVTQIQIIIQPVLGLQGSPTSTPATTPVPITSPISK